MEKKYKNILVIKLSPFGSFLMSLGAMKDIKDKFGDHAMVTLLTTPTFVKIAKDCGYFDRVIVDQRIRINRSKFDYKRILHFIEEYRRFRHKLSGFDFVIDLQANDRTKTYYYLLFPFKKPDWCGDVPFCKYRIDRKYRRHHKKEFDIYKKVNNQLNKIGVHNVSISDFSWMKSNISRFNLPKKYVVLVVGSSHSKRKLKRWSAVSFGRLANRVLAKGYTPVLIGTEEDKEAIKIVKEICPSSIDLMEQTSISDLVEIGRHTKFCVGNDSGPTIIIALSSHPTIILHPNSIVKKKKLPSTVDIHYVNRKDLNDLTVDSLYHTKPKSYN